MARRWMKWIVFSLFLLGLVVLAAVVLFPPPAGNAQDRVLYGHTDWVVTLRISEDLKTLATGSLDELALLWDTATGRRLHILEGHRDRVTRVLFSRDGKYLATGSADRTVRIWDVETGEEMRTLVGHPRHITYTEFSADGRLLSVCCDSNLVKIWDLETGEEVATLEGHNDKVSTATFTPDARYVVTGSDDKTVKIWDLSDGKAVHTLTGHQDWITSTKISRDGKHLVIASRDNTLSLWDMGPLAEGNPPGRRTVIPGTGDEIHTVRVAHDSRTLSVRNFPDTFQLIDLESGEQMRVLNFDQRVLASAFSEDFKRVITAEGRTTPDRSRGNTASEIELITEGSLAVWDVATGEKIASRPWSVPVIRRLHFATDGSLLSTASSHDGRVILSQVRLEDELPATAIAEQDGAPRETAE